MGMFDKDKEIGVDLTSKVAEGVEFILWGAKVDTAAVATRLGDARKTRLLVSAQDRPSDLRELVTLASAIADAAEVADSSDFPAVVFWTKVNTRAGNTAVVIRFVRPFGETDREATLVREVKAARRREQPVGTTGADDDIPF